MNPTAKMHIIHREREAYLSGLSSVGPGSAQPIHEALRYIHGHFYEEACTVQALKDDLGIRNHNFSSHFRYRVGLGIKEYIIHHRLSLAKRLLRYPELSIFQIAIGVGFSSHEAFTMAFKVREGCTPSVFRIQQKSAHFTS